MADKTKQFYVANGFNIADGKGGELRYDVGEKSPNIVDQKDFSKAVWADLVDAGAIAAVEDAKEV